jgi:hypothetical protein
MFACHLIRSEPPSEWQCNADFAILVDNRTDSYVVGHPKVIPVCNALNGADETRSFGQNQPVKL